LHIEKPPFDRSRPVTQARWGWAVLAGAAAAVALGWAAIYVPRELARQDCAACMPADRAKSISELRTAFLQFVVAIAGGATIYFTWKNYTRSLREADVNVTLAREGRTSDNFIKAVEQLGSPSPAVRAGGVVGLGRLLRTATTGGDYWPIMDVLTTFVRDQAPRTDSPHDWKPSQDVQAALNVVARRSATLIPTRTEDAPIDLHDCDLKLAWMSGANFQWAFFGSSRLVEADLSSARLDEARMNDADLTNADLSMASMRKADLSRCHLRNANLHSAKLHEANLSGADLGGADLTEAELYGADLSGAVLTANQLTAARGDAKTKLPPGQARPASWA
jgi:hypothetical protein